MDREELIAWLEAVTEDPVANFENEMHAVSSLASLCEQVGVNFELLYRNGWVEDIHANGEVGEPRFDEDEIGYRVGVDGRGILLEDGTDMIFPSIGVAAVAGLRVFLRVLRPMGETEE